MLAPASAAPADITVDVSVVDPEAKPVAGVVVRLQIPPNIVVSAVTGVKGTARFQALEPGRYSIAATKGGFETVARTDIEISKSGASLELTLAPSIVRRDSVDVRGNISSLDQGSSPSIELPVAAVKELPQRPATVSDALPLIPGVVRSPGGGLQFSGGGEHRGALIVNSADVTDPATGQFGLTVPIDQVESLNFYQTPFLAEFGRFTAGLVSVETRRGGDQWKWELNDPFPEFRIRSWQLRGLRTATPRLNFNGPLEPGKLYFSEGFEYEVRKTEVFTLPFPNNQKKQEGLNSFAQLDWIASNKQLVTATIHVAPQRQDFVNMEFFNPQSATPDAATHNYTGTIADHLTLGGGLWDNTVSVTQFSARVWGQGPQDLTIAPARNSGAYFAQQNRDSSRTSAASTYTFGTINGLGTHTVKMGAYLARSSDQGQVTEHPIDILGGANQLIERISFTGGQPFRMTDTEFAFFGQDHWNISSRVAMDFGVRAESQAVSEALRLAPRAGVAWLPFSHSGTVIRGGVGLFYDRVPLNVYSFGDYPNQVATFHNDGQVSAGPFFYQNCLGEVTMRPPFVFQKPAAGNFSPRSTTWSAQVEQPVASLLKLRVGYMRSQSAGLVVLNPIAPDPETGIGAHVLSGTGRSEYRQLEFTAKVRVGNSG